jgi:hypothetical protein
MHAGPGERRLHAGARRCAGMSFQSCGQGALSIARPPQSHLRVFPMRRPNWKTVSTLATVLVLVGCQERVSSPSLESALVPVSPALMRVAPSEHPQFSLSGGSLGNTSADFTVTASGGTFFAGNHVVVFPARSICDPETSTYGDGHWDEPCSSLKGSINVHAEVRSDALGHVWVDFTPALRFVPSDNPSRWVWMVMYTPAAIGATGDLSAFNILYARSIGGETVDESAIDATMRTYVDTRMGLSMRRAKHFSGFMTSSGRQCDPATALDDCTASP